MDKNTKMILLYDYYGLIIPFFDILSIHYKIFNALFCNNYNDFDNYVIKYHFNPYFLLWRSNNEY